MNEVNPPNWYRAMCTCQLDAAEKLLKALRYDREEASCNRVLNHLSIIGLRPLITPEQAYFVIMLSRGSDLAFLWFLYEIYYKTQGKELSINEQLIMSSIAHLDLQFTLRGLKSILPPAQKPKYMFTDRRHFTEPALNDRIRGGSLQRVPEEIASFMRNTKYKSPYFSTLTIPRLYGNPLHLQPPLYRLKLKFDDPDEHTIIPNETVRWFANYTTLAGDGDAKAGIFDRQILNCLKLPDMAKDFDEHELKSLKHDNILEHFDVNHKKKEVIEKQKQFMAHEMKVWWRNKILKQFDVTTKKKEECRARIRKQIEENVALHRHNFRHQMDKMRRKSYMQLLSSEYNIYQCDVNESFKGNIHCQDTKQRTAKPCCMKEHAESKREAGMEPEALELQRVVNGDVTGEERSNSADITEENEEKRKGSQSSPRESVEIQQEQHSPGENLKPLGKTNKGSRSTSRGKKKRQEMKMNPVSIGERRISVNPLQTRRQKGVKEIKLFDVASKASDESSDTSEIEEFYEPQEILSSEREVFENLTNLNSQQNSQTNFSDGMEITNQTLCPTKGNQNCIEKFCHSKCNPDRCAQLQKVHLKRILYDKKPDVAYDYIKSFDYGHKEKPSKQEKTTTNKNAIPTHVECNEDEMFFKAPDEQTPYKFDYKKIFNFLAKVPSQDKIQHEFPNAIDSKAELGGPPRGTAGKTFKKGAQQLKRDEPSKESARFFEEEHKLSFKMNYYDPEDEELMRRMLKEGLEILAKDPRYVLANFADADKYPLLMHWMYWRYGRTYTEKQLKNTVDKSLSVVRALRRMTLDVSLPSDTPIYIPCNRHDYYINELNRTRRAYYSYINKYFMEQSRRLYGIVNVPNHTFFAYMPSRIASIYHIHM